MVTISEKVVIPAKAGIQGTRNETWFEQSKLFVIPAKPVPESMSRGAGIYETFERTGFLLPQE